MARPVSWQHPRILAILLALFAAGAMSGALAVKLNHNRRVSQLAANTLNLEREKKEKSVERMSRDLNLSPDQVGSLRVVLDDYHKYLQMLDAQIKDLQDQKDGVRADGKERIRKILTDAQRQQFDQMSLDPKR